MDAYLESLVKKGEVVKAQVEEAAIPEPVEEVTAIEPEVAEAAESVVEEIKPAEEAKPAKAEKPAKSGSDKKKEAESKAPTKAEETKSNAGEIVAVKDIRIFNIPDAKSPFRIFTGNIVVNGKMDSFTEIQYVKPGFGLVKGFTDSLK